MVTMTGKEDFACRESSYTCGCRCYSFSDCLVSSLLLLLLLLFIIINLKF